MQIERDGIISHNRLYYVRFQDQMHYSTLGEFLQLELSHRKLSNRALAIGAGVSEFAIRNMLQHGLNSKAKDPDPRTLRAVADYLSIDPLYLFRLAGYIPPPKNAPSVRAEIVAEVFDKMDEEQQDAMLGIFEAMANKVRHKEAIQSLRTGSLALDGFDVGSPQTVRHIANAILAETKVTSAGELDRPDAISPDLVVAPNGLTWDSLPVTAKQRALGLAKAKLNLNYDPTMVDPKWRK